MLTGRIVRLDPNDVAAPARRHGTRRQPHRRTARAHRDAPGHAHHGPPVRHGPHDRGGAGQLALGRQQALSLHVRHARRSRAHDRRCRSLLRGLPQRDRLAGRACPRVSATSRRGRASRSSSRRCIRASSARIASACCRDLDAATGRALHAGARCGHRAHRRHRGVRAPRDHARTARGRVPRSAARGLVRLRHRRAGLPEARTGGAALPDRSWRARHAAHAARAAREGRVLGQRDQARAGTRPAGLSGVHAQVEHRRRLPRRARGSCWSRAASCIRSSPPTTRTRWPPCGISRASTGASSSSSDCTAWARNSMRR